MTRLLWLAAALVAAPAALAQHHGDHGRTDPAPAHHGDAAMGHDALMALHMRMMADPEIHAAMRADAELRALMMPMMDHGEMDHEGMDPGAHADAMMGRMHERMSAMSAAEHADFMARFEAIHRRLLATPAVHARAMADPELRRMMEAMPGGMNHGDMDHGQHGEMDHGGHQGMDHGQHGQMDHSQHGGMDRSQHGRMDDGDSAGMEHSDHGAMDHGQHGGVDHAAGVALQRRNAGAPNGDERPATPTVGPEAFEASATADQFHAALAAGDRAAVEALLAPDAVVLEGGRHEARAEYLSDHFARDAAFLAGAEVEPLFRRTTVAGDAAWVASTQRVGGAAMAELLVMRRGSDGWRVAAVHWSSAR